FARRRVEAINPGDHDFPGLSRGNDRCRQWMLAGAFDARRQTQKIALVPAIMCHDGNHRGLSLGKRARLVDTLVVDKTGTLTEGKPSVISIVAHDGWYERDLLRLAAGVERASEHPLAAAIVAAAEARKIMIPRVDGFDSPSGKGAIGTVDGKRVMLGNAAFFGDQQIDVSALASRA